MLGWQEKNKKQNQPGHMKNMLLFSTSDSIIENQILDILNFLVLQILD